MLLTKLDTAQTTVSPATAQLDEGPAQAAVSPATAQLDEGSADKAKAGAAVAASNTTASTVINNNTFNLTKLPPSL